MSTAPTSGRSLLGAAAHHLKVRLVAVGWRRWLALLRHVLLLLALVYGTTLFARAVAPDSKILSWVIWRYPVYWSVAGVWVAACSFAGFGVLHRVLRSPLPLLENWTFCFAIGLLTFFLLMFVGGLLGLYGSPFFVAILLVLFGIGGRPAVRYLRRLRRALRAARRRPRSTTPAAVWMLWGLGLIALFLFYVPSLVPSQIGYDSAWYHVPLGEHYARLGRIARLPEGWLPGAIPHLPSIVYCFAFLLPGGKLFDYVELASHLEFATTLMALVGIPALIRRLVPRARAHVGWIAFFAFPSVYYYDSLIGGDQISAVWGIPIALGLLRTLPELSWRFGVLLACGMAGEALTKYSASGILLGPVLAVTVRVLWRLAKSVWQRVSWRELLRACGGGIFTGLLVIVLTTPLWAKNWLWYGDPFYPLLRQYFHSHPWSPDAAAYLADYKNEIADWAPSPGWTGVKEALLAVVHHGLKPTDYSPLPLRGALFSLLCGTLPFVRANARLWGIAAMVNLAVFGWYMQLHQDRYLMAFWPLMAAVLAAIAVLIWQASWLSRALLLALCTVHTAWGLGIFAHSVPNGQYRRLLDFVAALSSGSAEAGMGDLARWDQVGKSLPAKAMVVVHGMHAHAGLGHPSISDWPRIQLGISYGRLNSPAAMFAELKRLGATHLVWQSETWPDDSYAGDLRFYEFVKKYAAPRNVQGLWVAAMPAVSPPATPEDPLVAFLGCDGHYAAGLYRFSAMTNPNPRRNWFGPYPSPLEVVNSANASAAIQRAHYAIYKHDCGISRPPGLSSEFLEIGRRDGYELFARRD